MERVPDEAGAVSWNCKKNTQLQETPSESSEAESSETSTADEDEEGWESGQF